MTWFIGTAAGLGLTLIVAAVISFYRQGDAVVRGIDAIRSEFALLRVNHLAHIEENTKESADRLAEVKGAIDLHDANALGRFELLKEIIRKGE